MTVQEKEHPRRIFLKTSIKLAAGAGMALLAEPIIFKTIAEYGRTGPPELDPIPNSAMLFGIAPDNNDIHEVDRVREALGQDIQIVNLFYGSYGEISPGMKQQMKNILDAGLIPMNSWYPGVSPLAFLPEEAIRQGARDMKSLGGVILFRPIYEMNGPWTPWHTVPEQVIISWRQIFDIYQEEEATNVKFVFSPNVTTGGATSIEPFYPGGRYVHFTALDVYDRYSPNLLSQRHWTVPDLSPEHLIGPDLVTFMTIAPDKPFLIAEIGSMDRPEWVPDAIEYVKRHMRTFVGAISFEWNKAGQGPTETDWRMLGDTRRLEGLRGVLEKYKKNDPKGPADVLIRALS